MQLQNFECQIAKAQIGRYVAGDSLSDEALQQLEAHVAKCDDCKQNLAERRASLQAMLTPSQETPSVKPETSRFDLGDLIRSRIQAKQPVQAVVQASATKPTVFTKPALYSVALGAVLIGMSYVSKNMTSVLGPKAAEITSSAPAKPVQQKPVIQGPVAKPPVAPATNSFNDADAIAIGIPTEKPAAPSEKPDEDPTPVRKPKANRKSERKSSHDHKKPHRSTNTIRVYAPEN